MRADERLGQETAERLEPGPVRSRGARSELCAKPRPDRRRRSPPSTPHWRRAHRAAYLVVHDAAAAEDIAQEAFLAAIDALDRFDRRRPFGPWLHRIVVNRAIDWARAALRQSARSGRTTTRHAGPCDRGIRRTRSISDALVAALPGRSPEQRAPIVLRYLLEYTPGEIGEMLELPRGTVNSRLRRGLDRLRRLWRRPG